MVVMVGRETGKRRWRRRRRRRNRDEDNGRDCEVGGKVKKEVKDK